MSIYITQSPKYCVYLTIYSGDKMPMFYIGSSSIKKVKNKKKPYRGSVLSKRFKHIWKKELKENPHLFRTIILYKFYSRKNAMYNEYLLQKQFNVVKSDKFINMAIAAPNGFFGMNYRGFKRSKEYCESISGENNHFYSKHHTKETLNKLSVIASSREKIKCEYCEKETTVQNYSQFHGDKCKYNPNIDQEILLLRSNISKKQNDKRKMIKCEYCHKEFSTNMYNRWHGNNCKSAP